MKRSVMAVLCVLCFLLCHAPVCAQGSFLKGSHVFKKYPGKIPVSRSMKLGLASFQTNPVPIRLNIEQRLKQNMWNQQKRAVFTYQDVPGYFSKSFSKEWARYQTMHPQFLRMLQSGLQTTFPSGEAFEGHFVRSLQDLRSLSHRPIGQGVSAADALQQAVKEGETQENGFFAVVVAGNSKRAREVMVLDLEKGQWIPFNSSSGKAFAKHREWLATEFVRQYPELADILKKRGVLVRIQKEPIRSVAISTDGLIWHKKDLFSQQGKDLYYAVENNFLIKLDFNTQRFVFAAEENAPYLATVKDVLLWKTARQEGFVWHSENHHLKLFFPATGYENVFCLAPDRSLVPAAGRPLTLKEFDAWYDGDMIREVQEKQRKAAGRALLYHPARDDMPEALVEYLSADRRYASDDLREVETYERMLLE